MTDTLIKSLKKGDKVALRKINKVAKLLVEGFDSVQLDFKDQNLGRTTVSEFERLIITILTY